jgi:hypothetical protein
LTCTWVVHVGGSRGFLVLTDLVGGSRGFLVLTCTAAGPRRLTALKTHGRGDRTDVSSWNRSVSSVGGSRGFLVLTCTWVVHVGGSRGFLVLTCTAARRRRMTALKTHGRGDRTDVSSWNRSVSGRSWARSRRQRCGWQPAAVLTVDRTARGPAGVVVGSPSQAGALKGNAGGKAQRGNIPPISRARWCRRRTPARKASTNAR